MQRQKLALMDHLGHVLVTFMEFRYFGGTVTTVITVRYDHLSLKLFLPVRRVDHIPLQVIALLMSKLNIVPAIAPAH
jgi:hypothetical protein